MFLVALYIKTFAVKALRNSRYNALLVTKIITFFRFIYHRLCLMDAKVKVSSDYIIRDSSCIGGHRDGFKQNFRACHGASDIKYYAAVCEFGYFICIDKKIPSGTSAFRLTIKGRMLIDYIGAYSNVNGEGNVILITGGKNTDLRMAKTAR